MTKKERVGYIKDLYKYYQNRIKKGKYYLNEYKINSGGLQWQSKSNLQKIERYYYSYTGDGKPILRLISLSLISGGRVLETKFIYDQDENLVLSVESQNLEQEYPYRKLSAYFGENGSLVKLYHDKTDIPYTSLEQNPHLIDLQKQSRKLAGKFNKHFLEVEKKTGN